MKKVETVRNISYNTFTTTGLANYASSTTAPYRGYDPFIYPLSIDDQAPFEGKYNCINIANWFLEKESMSLEKLQKMCYYAYAWCWAKNHFQIIKTTFFAMANGPTSRDIADFFDAKKNELLHPMPDFLTNFDNVSTELLESVWETYGEYTENALNALSETEAPWQVTYAADPSGNGKININLIIEYYNSIAIKNG